MGWARLDDRWHDHPKVIAAGLEAAGLWTMCLTWAHSNRRTSPTPGVVPAAVIARFAGSKARKLTARLAELGLFDAETPAGWPIHDFVEYLPKYDPEQARVAGAAGGRAKSTNRTAKQTASEPLDESPAIPPSGQLAVEVADQKRSSRTRASARRNPEPVSDGLRPSDAAADAPTAQQLVAEWIELCGGVQPDPRFLGETSKELKRLLAAGIPYDQVLAGLRIWHERGLAVGALKSCVHGVRVHGEQGRAVPGQQRPTEPDPAWDLYHAAAGGAA